MSDEEVTSKVSEDTREIEEQIERNLNLQSKEEEEGTGPEPKVEEVKVEPLKEEKVEEEVKLPAAIEPPEEEKSKLGFY